MKIQMDQTQPEGTMQTSPGTEKTPNGTGKTPKAPIDLSQHQKAVKILCVVLAVLLFVAGVRIIGSARTLNASIADQEKRIQQLTKEKEALSGEEAGETSGEEEEETDRKTADGKAASAFLEKFLTWDSYEGYNGIRTWLMESCGASADDPLLTHFMPELTEDAFGTANMAFDSASSYVVSEDGENISYFALCEVENRNADGDPGYGRVGVFYTLDGEGNISGVSAYPLAE